jgi:heme-degrading monooxygenase HmoA
MFMRFLQVKIKSDFVSQFQNFYEKTVLGNLQKVHGCMFAGLIKSGPEGNDFVSLTFWETQQQAEEYEKSPVFKNLIELAKPFLSESTEWKIQLSDKMELEYAPVIEEPVIKKYSVADTADDSEKINLKNQQMYVRIVSIKIQEGKLNEFKELYHNRVISALKSTQGCRHVFLTQSVQEKDEFISVTIWDSKKDADAYEASGKFKELVRGLEKTFSQFYLWKMQLEKDYSAKVKTSEDMKVEKYDLITGKNFL